MRKRILSFALVMIMALGNGNFVYASGNQTEEHCKVEEINHDKEKTDGEKQNEYVELKKQDTATSEINTNELFAYIINDETDDVTITKYIGNQSYVNIPNNIDGRKVSKIGDYAFQYCSEIKEIELSEGIIGIGMRSFEGCDNLITIRIPTSVESIGYETFLGCSSLKSVEGGEGLKSIDSNAFKYCRSLESIILSESIESMGRDVFYDCENLKTAGPKGENYNIQFGWKNTIPQYAFENSWVEYVKIAEGITEIGDNAFASCENLKDIEFSETIKKIGSRSFNYANSLMDINIPASVESIGYEAFLGCSSLKSVEGGEGLKSIDSNAFKYCRSLESIILSESIESMGRDVFYDCENLKTAGPKGENYNIQFGWKNTIPQYAFENSWVEYVKIAEGITEIGDNAFASCENLKDIEFSETIKKIGSRSFNYANSLMDINIPASVESIGYEAFLGCSRLVSVEFGKEIKSIGANAFRYCNNLKEIYFLGNAPFFYAFNGLQTFENVTATAYYPIGDPTWTDEVKQNYGGDITWIPWNPTGINDIDSLMNYDKFQAEYYSKNASTITSGYMTYTEIEDNYTPTDYVLNNILSFGWNKKFGFSDDAQIWETILLDIILQRSASEKMAQNWEEDVLQLSDTLCMEALNRDISSLEDSINSANLENINELISEYEMLKGISTAKSTLDDLMGAADSIGQFLESYAKYVELRSFVNDDMVAFLNQMKNTSEYQDIPAFRRALDNVIKYISIDDAELVQLIVQEQASRAIITKAVNTAVGHVVDILIPGVGTVVDFAKEGTICMMNTICGTEEQAQVNVYLYIIDRIDQAAEEAFLNAAESYLSSGGNSYKAVNGGLQFITDLSTYGVSICRQWNQVISTDILSRVESGPYMSVKRPHYDMTNEYLNLGHASTEKEKNEYIEELCLNDEKFIDTVLCSMPGFAQTAWYEESGASQNDSVSLVMFYVLNPVTDSRVMYTQVVLTNSTVSFPDIGKKNGYVTPSTWYQDQECTQEADSNQRITGNTVFYTKWRPSIFYEQVASGGISIVSMNADGGGIGGRAVQSEDTGLFWAKNAQMSGATYEIPAYIDGYRVEALGNDIFAGCTGVSRVILPGTLLSINDSAFDSLGKDTMYQYVQDSFAEEYILGKNFPNTESVQELSFAEIPEQLLVGQTVQLQLVQEGSCIADVVQWTSSDETIASVSDGTLTGLTEGIATITASVGGVTVSFEISVEPNARVGDLNNDGIINVVDLMMCLHHVSGRTVLDGDARTAADINGDGTVNVVDLMRMLHYVSGRNSSL